MIPFWLSFTFCIFYNNAAKLSFKPSSTNVPDEYCSHQLNDQSVSPYCDDIDNILHQYCGNNTFLTIIDPTYDHTLDPDDDECIIYLEYQQTIDKTYSLSDDIQTDHIRFSSQNETSTYISLSQPFLSITSYQGSIHINNIDFTSNGDTFSFINIISDDTQLDININLCEFSNIYAVNGSIISIPNHSETTSYTNTISIEFEDCVIENTTAEYGGILYIERNNVYATLSDVDINNLAVSEGGVIHWICQQKRNDVDLCGDVFVIDTQITNTDANIFSIDLSLDPSQIQFILDIDTSTFDTINGIIFNFNHNDDELAPTGHRIQEQNAYIHVVNCRFEDNGHNNQAIVKQWNHFTHDYMDWFTNYINGTIFKINAVTVPNITVESSNFTNNAGLFGTIFDWYCSRRVQWIKDNYCGSIALQNNVFTGNSIPVEVVSFPRFGSLLYAQIHQIMEFNLMISGCTFMQQNGNVIYFEKSTAPIPDAPDIINGSFANYSIYSNVSVDSNFSFDSNSSVIDWTIPISMIYIEDSRFMECTDYQIYEDSVSTINVGTILTIKGLEMVYNFITDSIFEGNQRKDGSAVFLADYAPIININNSQFIDNGAIQSGILHIEQDKDSMIGIYDSIFRDNGFYHFGDHTGQTSIISTADDVGVSLDIAGSSFIHNENEKYSCFNLYRADVQIRGSTFTSNRGEHWSAIILYLRESGHLNITDTVFDSNAEISSDFHPPTTTPRGMFHLSNADVITQNVTFMDNRVLNNGIYVTNGGGSITLVNDNYTGNEIPAIVDGAENSVRIDNCMFMDNVAPDNAFEDTFRMVQARDITVIDSDFIGNSGYRSSLFGYGEDTFSLTLHHSNFIDNIGVKYGSVVFINGSNVQIDIDNCVFDSNNVSHFGGAVYVEGLATISITNTTMIHNSADSGGFLFAKGIALGITLNITDTYIRNNFAFGGLGGVMFIENVAASIKNVTMHSNVAVLTGGAIFANGDNVIDIEQCHFDSNFVVKLNGGAIYLYQSDLICNECFSDSNIAHDGTGGFLYMDSGSNVHMNNAVLLNDMAKVNGGVVFIEDTSDRTHSYFECNNCNVSNATADLGAMIFSYPGNTVILNDNNVFDCNATTSSAIVLFDNEAEFTRCTFENNQAGFAGGAVFASDSTVDITECGFYDNSAKYYAGAIYVGDNNKLNVLDSTFEGNIAMFGGAIAIRTGSGTNERYNTIYMDIESTSFMNNIAHKTGGALYVKREAQSIEDADTYYHNISLKPGNTWDDNRAVKGGAIAMDFRSKTPTGVTIEVCDPDLILNQFIDIVDNVFTNNFVEDDTESLGGALYFICMDLKIYQSEFESNYASYHNGGGAAYLSDTKTFIDASTFSSSHHAVDYDGELFYIYSDDDGIAQFTMVNSTISSFEAPDTFDAANHSLISIGSSVASMTFENISFTENGVPLIYAQIFLCANVTFTHSQFTNNYGWTVIDMDHVTYHQDESITLFDDVVFEDNTVIFGLIRLGTSYAKIYDSIIEGNMNTLLISTFILVNNAWIQNSLIIDNNGKNDGILTISDGGTANIRNTHFIDNHVGGVGGAIHSKASQLYIYESKFINNSAQLNGGHIAQFENKLVIRDSVFEGGQAVLGNGGALWMSRYNVISGMIAMVYNTSFKGNYAQFHGGAILQDTPSRTKENSLLLQDVEFIENTANHSGAAIYIRNKYEIQFIERNVSYLNNVAAIIDTDKESWPCSYSLSSPQFWICPGCNVSVSMNATNIFGNPWIPHKFTEALFITTNVPDINITATTTIADFATHIKRDFEIKQRMSSLSGITTSTAQIKSVYQSESFINGVGTEVFTYGPAILDDTLTFIVAGFLRDGFVVVDEVNITFAVRICDKHMGSTVFGSEYGIPDGYHSFLCEECVKNHYRFLETATEKCNICPPRAVCEGGANVFVENDHYPLITEHSGFEVLECVPGTCCLQSLCLWSEFDTLCPENRNATSPMCSTCLDTYSVSPLSTECIICEGINIWYFIVPAIAYGMLIWWWGHRSPFSTDLSAWEIYTFKTLSFYYQILPSINLLIPDISETTDYSATIEGIFNFDPQIEGVCAYENLTNFQQILLTLVTPIFCVLWVAIFWFLNKIECCALLRKTTKSTIRGAGGEKIGTALCSFFFLKALVKFFIQVYAQLTRTTFSLLSCRSFGDGTNHMYYSADIECYQWWHIFAFLGVGVAIVLPVIALYLLFKAKKHLKVSAWWHILTLGYKRHIWWYDVFRMACRLFVILLVSIPVLEAYRLVLTRWLIYIYMIIHMWLLPLDTQKYLPEIAFDINHLETFCLGLLCVLVHLADYEQTDVLEVYNLLKLLPAVLLIVLVFYTFSVKLCCAQILPETGADGLGTMRGISAFHTQSPLDFQSAVDVQVELGKDPNHLAVAVGSTKHVGETNGAMRKEGEYYDGRTKTTAVAVDVDDVMEMIDDDDEYEEDLKALGNINKFKETFRQKLEVSVKMLSFDKSKTKSKSHDGKVYETLDDQMSPTDVLTPGDEVFDTPIPTDADFGVTLDLKTGTIIDGKSFDHYDGNDSDSHIMSTQL